MVAVSNSTSGSHPTVPFRERPPLHGHAGRRIVARNVVCRDGAEMGLSDWNEAAMRRLWRRVTWTKAQPLILTSLCGPAHAGMVHGHSMQGDMGCCRLIQPLIQSGKLCS